MVGNFTQLECGEKLPHNTLTCQRPFPLLESFLKVYKPEMEKTVRNHIEPLLRVSYAVGMHIDHSFFCDADPAISEKR